MLTSLNFEGAQTILIQIVGIHLLHGKGRIAVSSPAAAEVEFVIDTSDAIMAGESQAEGIVLAITGVGELQLSQDRSEECTGSSKSVDAQSVVGAILVCPFPMVYQSRRQRIQLKVAHAVTANHHCGLLLIEGINHLLQRVG